MRLLPLAFLTVLAASAQAQQTAERFSDGTHAYRYLLALPDGYADATGAWPLVLFLHGSGERGDSLDLVAVHGPPRLVREGHAFPFILVSPQQPLGGWWDVEGLGALLDDVQARYRVDPDRVYVTGLSMGGFGTFGLAAAFPDRFAALAPVCGGGDTATAAAFRHVPAWIFHGMRDNVVPPARSTEMFDALRAAGAPEVGLTLYPDADHNSWDRTYANPDLYAWLLRHRRSDTNGTAP